MMPKIDTAKISRLIAAGGMVIKHPEPPPVRSWHDDPDDRDRELRHVEPDDTRYWRDYRIFFNRKAPMLAGIDFHDLPSVHYDALRDRWSADSTEHTESVIAAVRKRLDSAVMIPGDAP
ncbi:hypothetical protein AA12717_3752 [Gluconacetobacter sacchari DSM 12717]|nr:hypothetical protein [Gluconacetobacter sacchari]GBQ31402.1 hypothetical protein AA12717_3752 [Gluconacetobacter sacchari DSM 12717]